MTSVRLATEADIPTVLEMSKKFYPTTPYAAHVHMDDESVNVLTRLLIDSGIMLIAEVNGKTAGMIGMAVFPFMFNHNLTAAGEVVWWVEEEYRNSQVASALMYAMEKECRDAGVDYITMLALSTSPPQAGAMYKRLGYAVTENVWAKAL